MAQLDQYGGPRGFPVPQEQQALIKSTLAHRSDFWLNEFHLSTEQTYASREKTWLRFCELFGFSYLELPTQIQYELFGTWLAAVAKRGENPFKMSSFQQYMRHIARMIELDFPPPLLNVARSPKAERFVKAVSRSLSSTKQRARPVRVADLIVLSSRLPLFYLSILAKLVRVIALVAFWGCLRLGTLLQDSSSKMRVLTWRDFVCDGNRVFVSIFRDKTVKQLDDCHRIVLEPIAGNSLICPVRAYLDYVAKCSSLGLSLDDPFAKFSRELPSLSFDKFLVIFNVIVPAIPATPSVKGNFTGHSFRRGHAQAAIALGIEVDDLISLAIGEPHLL
jgi:hypothetical protein